MSQEIEAHSLKQRLTDDLKQALRGGDKVRVSVIRLVMTAIKNALDRVFTNAPTIMERLGNEFTSQNFIRKVMHDQQHAYIDLLVACKHLDTPFDQAHQKIGRQLKSIATEYGYEALPDKVPDTNIFRNGTESTVYRRR